jgi:hypothetical protein
MHYFARFEMIDGHLFRFDTRIYLGGYENHEQGMCVGAIVGKNPGSALPEKLSELVPLNLNRDKMLPYVRNCFLDGYKKAGRILPTNAFVRVWNLFYICNPVFADACAVAGNLEFNPICPSENEAADIVWFAWGKDIGSLSCLKERFLSRSVMNGFFYNKATRSMVPRMPAVNEFAKHPQGMPRDPIVTHLAGIL